MQMQLQNSAVYAGIGCISTLIANVTHDASPILRLAERCFAVVLTQAKSLVAGSTPTNAQSAQLQRCLVVLGGICAHSKKIGDFLRSIVSEEKGMTAMKKWSLANEDAAKKPLVSFSTLNPYLLTACCYSAAAFAFGLNDEVVRGRAVQALCDVFSGNPRLMLVAQSTGHLQQILDIKNNVSIHERLITGLRQMLTNEEAALEKRATLKQLQDSGVQLVDRNLVLGPADSDSDSSIAGFVIQQHLHLLTRFFSHPSSPLRLLTLELLGSLLRQGMVCPLDALASLIMLQCDRDVEIRREALHLLVIQDERHPTFLDNRLREGVEAAFDFQNTIYGDIQTCYSAQVAAEAIPYFGELYIACIQPNKKRSQGFIQSLLRKCALLSQSCSISSNNSLDHISNELNSHINSLAMNDYLASVLSSLPFVQLDEVLYLLSQIHRTVPYDMNVIMNELKTSILSHNIAALADDINMPPPPTSTSKSGKKRSRAALTASAEQELIADPTRFTDYCSSQSQETLLQCFSSMLALVSQLRCKESLIRLKAFLKLIYGLNDERCQAFDANAKSNTTTIERAQRIDPTAVFTASCPDATALQHFATCLPQFLGNIDIKTITSAFQLIVDEYNRLSLLLKWDPDDFKISSNTKSKTTPRKSANAASSVSSNVVNSNKRAKKKVAIVEEDDEEYVSDHSSRGMPSTPSRTSSRRSAKRAVSYLQPDDLED
jgi:hypothetical protein